MSPTLDVDLLDEADPAAILAADPERMLEHVASAPAQLRAAAVTAREVDLTAVDPASRPRAIVVAGMGGSGIAGDVLAAVAGAGGAVPIVTHRGYGLPGWVGPSDLVVAVSCSGGTEETLSAAEESYRRGARLVGLGAADSPLAERVDAARGVHFVVPGGRMPRASLWSLATPLLVLGDAFGACRAPAPALAAAADLLDELSARYAVTRDSFVNRTKELALAWGEALPLVWGTSPLAGVAAYRCAGQLAENAKTASQWGVLPEANHNQVVVLDSPDAAERVRLVLLRDLEEHPQVAKRAEASKALAEARGVPVDEIVAEGAEPVARLASLVAVVDFTSVYLALARGVDPTPIEAITDLKAGIAR